MSKFKRDTEMPEFFQGEVVIFNITFYSDRFRTVEVDPGTVALTVEEPDETDVIVIATTDGARPDNLGKYTATFPTTKFGVHNYEWVTATPQIVKPGKFNVVESEVEN